MADEASSTGGLGPPPAGQNADLEEVERLRKQNEHLRVQLRQFSTALDDVLKKKAKDQEQHHKSAVPPRDLQVELRSAEQRARQYKREAQSLRERVDAMDFERLGALEVRARQAEASLEELRKENKMLQRNLRDREKHLSLDQGSNEVAERRLRMQREELRVARAEARRFASERYDLERQNKALNDEVVRAGDRVRDLEEVLKERGMSPDDSAAESERKLEEALGRIAQLEKELSVVTKSRDAAVRRARTELGTLRRTLDETMKENAVNRERLSSKERELRSLAADLSLAQRTASMAQARVIAMQKNEQAADSLAHLRNRQEPQQRSSANSRLPRLSNNQTRGGASKIRKPRSKVPKAVPVALPQVIKEPSPPATPPPKEPEPAPEPEPVPEPEPEPEPASAPEPEPEPAPEPPEPSANSAAAEIARNALLASPRPPIPDSNTAEITETTSSPVFDKQPAETTEQPIETPDLADDAGAKKAETEAEAAPSQELTRSETFEAAEAAHNLTDAAIASVETAEAAHTLTEAAIASVKEANAEDVQDAPAPVESAVVEDANDAEEIPLVPSPGPESLPDELLDEDDGGVKEEASPEDAWQEEETVVAEEPRPVSGTPESVPPDLPE